MKLNMAELTKKAFSAHKKGNYEKAERLYKKILNVNSKDINIYNLLAVAQKNLGKLNEAEKNFRKILEIKPSSPDVYYNLGNMLRKKRRYDEAIENYKYAIKIKSNFVGAYYNLASAYKEIEAYEEAIKNYKKVLELDPNYKELNHIIASLEGDNTSPPSRDYVEKLFDLYSPEFDTSLVENLKYKIPQLISNLIVNKDTQNSLGSILDLGCGTGLVGSELKKYCSYIIGIDLSKSMLEIAQKKKIYDKLIYTDIADYLNQENLKHNYFIAADVFIYIGNLDNIFELIKSKNETKGKLIFSTEINNGDSYALEKHGRYSHSEKYIKALCNKYDYKISYFKRIPLRKEKEIFLSGGLYILDF
jgi:predicted TPR repeat methyltransferase